MLPTIPAISATIVMVRLGCGEDRHTLKITDLSESGKVSGGFYSLASTAIYCNYYSFFCKLTLPPLYKARFTLTPR